MNRGATLVAPDRSATSRFGSAGFQQRRRFFIFKLRRCGSIMSTGVILAVRLIRVK
jgi:hypothetical protein